jgi:ABC-type glutathione transport system ATPase component
MMEAAEPRPPATTGSDMRSAQNAVLAVEARGLVKTFGTNRAVDGIDLSVYEGEIFGVLGPNGAGKTTMLQMLATLLPIESVWLRRRTPAPRGATTDRGDRPVRLG